MKPACNALPPSLGTTSSSSHSPDSIYRQFPYTVTRDAATGHEIGTHTVSPPSAAPYQPYYDFVHPTNDLDLVLYWDPSKDFIGQHAGDQVSRTNDTYTHKASYHVDAVYDQDGNLVVGADDATQTLTCTAGQSLQFSGLGALTESQIKLGTGPLPDTGYPAVYFNTSGYGERAIGNAIQTADGRQFGSVFALGRFQWQVNGGRNQTVFWDEAFTPFTDSTDPFSDPWAAPVQHDIHTWQSQGATQSPIYVVDPRTRHNGQYGRYDIQLLTVEINYAQGAQKDQAVSQIACWQPNDGIGKGEPIYSSPSADLQIMFKGGSMNATFLGHTYQLSPSGSDPLTYITADQAVTVQLSAAPLSDPNVVEAFTALVNQPAIGVQNAVYQCQETSANSSTFNNELNGIVVTLGSSAMTLEVYSGDHSQTYQLQATNQPRRFSGNGVAVTLVNNPALTNGVDTLYLSISSSAFQLSNSVFTVVETAATSNTFRNFAPPQQTDSGIEPVPDLAPVYIQVPKIFVTQGQAGTNAVHANSTNSDGQGSTLSLLAKMQDGTWSKMADVPMIDSSVAGLVRSAQPLLFIPEGADLNQMPSGAMQNYQTLTWPLLAQADWDKGGGIVRIQNDQQQAVDAPVILNGIALESFYTLVGIGTGFGQGLDTNGRAKKPFESMGYTMYHDYSAPTPKTLSNYIKGKAVWYSMSHGATPDGTANTEFGGLNFKDSDTAGTISTAKLTPLNLNYYIVIVDGCCSAQTSTISEADSQSSEVLLDGPKAFADAFGSQAAYVGWSWTEPPSIQKFTGQFISLLKGGNTVAQAQAAFRKDNARSPGSLELKVYGKTDNVPDRTAAKKL